MKKSFKVMIAFLVIGLLSVPMFANDETQNNNAAGVYIMGWNPELGNIYGLQYQHWFDNDIGFQVTFGGRIAEETYYNYDAEIGQSTSNVFIDKSLSLGAHFLYSVFTTNPEKAFYTKFYLWAMGGAIAYSNGGLPFSVDGCAGIGIGSEFVFWHRMSIPLEFGFAGNFPNVPRLSFSGAIGLRFRF